jgi:ribosomal protein S4
VGNRRVTVPGYIVTREEESNIAYAPRSPLANANHPLRQTITVAATSETKSREIQKERE